MCVCVCVCVCVVTSSLFQYKIGSSDIDIRVDSNPQRFLVAIAILVTLYNFFSIIYNFYSSL